MRFSTTYTDAEGLFSSFFKEGYALGTVAEPKNRINYTPFGNQIEDLAFYKADTLDYLFNAQPYEKETGLYHYFARQYDPTVGRWNNIDPLAEEYPDLTPYDFVGGNPVNHLDPLGMDWYRSETGAITWFDSHEPQHTDGSGTTYENIGSWYVQEHDGIYTLFVGEHFSQVFNSTEFTFKQHSQAPDFYFPKEGDRVMEPLEGFWERLWYADTREYRGHRVDSEGIMRGPAPIQTGNMDLVGGFKNPGAVLKGLSFLKKFKNAETTVKKYGSLTKYTAKVLSQKGKGHTIYTKVLNANGKTVKWYHDTFDKTGKFLHRGLPDKSHLWWDGKWILQGNNYTPR